MKRWALLLAVAVPFLITACGSSKGSNPPPVFSYYSTDTPQKIPNADGNYILSDIEVTGGPSFISQVEVTVAILHSEVSDLELVLTSPEGWWIYLTDNHSDGEDFWYTTFTEDAVTWIVNTDSDDDPRTGYYLPFESLDDFIGEDPVGTWTLDVEDNSTLDDGYLIGWSIDIQ